MVSHELAPLEAHVETQIQHLKAVSGVVRELRSAEEQYATEYTKLPFDMPIKAKAILKRLPQLQGVSESFSLFVHQCAVVKAAVAEDLTKEVIAPLEAFADDHVEKAQYLLSELYELLQKETAFNLAYENLREGCKEDEVRRENSTASELTSPVLDESELILHRMHRDRLLQKRDAERLAIQQWITALHFAGQRYEAHVRNVVRQIRVVYERMVAALAVLTSELQAQVGENVSSSDNNFSCDDSWESFMAGYDCHIAVTCWMSELFKQLIPAEHKAAKYLQKAVKLNRVLSKAFGDVEFSSELSGLIGFHGLLTVNIANPIMRTLKFSQERQERMRNELSKSLTETGTLVVAARARLEASMSEKVEEETPVRCNSLTSSESSDSSVEDNNEEDEDSCDTAAEEEVPVESTPGRIQLTTLERKLSLQRQEITHVLEQTSFLAVKTMELMVQDYSKHVVKALAALNEAIHTEPQEIQQNASLQPWEHITERLSIAISDQPVLPAEDTQNRRRCSKKNAVVRRCRVTCATVSEPSVVQVLLSFVQSAVGVAYWASELGFRTAKTHMPHSFEERAVLAAVVVVILALINLCVRSTQLQNAWSDLTDTHHSNLGELTQIMKLSLELCTQQMDITATRSLSSA